MHLPYAKNLGLIAIATFLSFPASADLKQQLIQCASIQDKLDRLICYDAMAEQSKDHRVIATTPQAITPKIDVVAPVATTNSFGKASKQEVNRIELQVKSVKANAYGELTIAFENGQVWKQNDTRRFKLKAGETVYIEKGALGSFLLGKKETNSTIRVKRLD